MNRICLEWYSEDFSLSLTLWPHQHHCLDNKLFCLGVTVTDVMFFLSFNIQTKMVWIKEEGNDEQKVSKRSVYQILLFRTWHELVTCISATMFSSGFRWTVKASLISLTPSKRTSISTKCCVSPSLNSISENMRHLKINVLIITTCDSRPSHERWQLYSLFKLQMFANLV